MDGNLEPVIEKLKNKIIENREKKIGQAELNDGDVIDWPQQVKYIIETIDLIENNTEMSDEVMDYFFERAKKEDMSFYNFLKKPKIQKMIRAEVQKITTPIFYIKVENIRERLLKCISMVNEASKRLDFRQYLDSNEGDLIFEIIGALIWIFERIDEHNGTIRIKSLSNLYIKCIMIKTNIVRLTHLFRDDGSSDLNFILEIVSQNSERLLPMILAQFDHESISSVINSIFGDSKIEQIIHNLFNGLHHENRANVINKIIRGMSISEISALLDNIKMLKLDLVSSKKMSNLNDNFEDKFNSGVR
ncbi:MAG: hypothetical protein ACTSQS_14580 [Promethearchaeota archaeon]